MKRLINKVFNWYLSNRYQLNINKKMEFKGEKTTYDLSKFIVSDGSIYKFNGLTGVHKPECVEYKDNSIYIHSKPYNKFVDNGWQDPAMCYIQLGHIHFGGMYPATYGTWEVKIKYDKGSLPAVWMLRERYGDIRTSVEVPVKTWDNRIIFIDIPEHIDQNWFVYKDSISDDNFLGTIKAFSSDRIYIDRDVTCKTLSKIIISKDNITPEVDILELINNKYCQTIHHGYSIDKYETKVFGSRFYPVAPKTDVNIVTVAVTISPEGYKFYTDGELTTEVWEGMSDKPLYLMINNTSDTGFEDKDNVMVVTEINYYG